MEAYRLFTNCSEWDSEGSSIEDDEEETDREEFEEMQRQSKKKINLSMFLGGGD